MAAARAWAVGRAAAWGKDRLFLTLNSPDPFSCPVPAGPKCLRPQMSALPPPPKQGTSQDCPSFQQERGQSQKRPG